MHSWTLSTTSCPVRCCNYASWVQRCDPVLPLLKAVGTAGVWAARRALEHHLLTPMSALPRSNLPPRVQVRKHLPAQLSGQPSPALPTDWQMSHPVCGLTLVHHHRIWGEIPKQQCLQSGPAPWLGGCPTSSPPQETTHPDAGLTSDDFSTARFPGRSPPTPLSTHLSYITSTSRCCEVFQHHWNVVSEDEKNLVTPTDLCHQKLLQNSFQLRLKGEHHKVYKIALISLNRQRFPLQTPAILFLSPKEDVCL